MAWEEHIEHQLKEVGYFEPEDYVLIFRKGDTAVRIAEVKMVACCPASITFTSDELPPTEADSVRLLHGSCRPALDQAFTNKDLLSGRIRVKFKRPLQ